MVLANACGPCIGKFQFLLSSALPREAIIEEIISILSISLHFLEQHLGNDLDLPDPPILPALPQSPI